MACGSDPNSFPNNFPNNVNRQEGRRFMNKGNEYRRSEFRPRMEYQGERGRDTNVEKREDERRKSVQWEEPSDDKYCIAHHSYGDATDACRWQRSKLLLMLVPEARPDGPRRAGETDTKMKESRQGNWAAGPLF